jgi:hypothetical protein
VRHNKRGRKDGEGRGAASQQKVCLSRKTGKNKNIFSLLISIVSGILIHRLSHYTVFCEAKELGSSSSDDTHLNPRSPILHPKPNNFISW